MRNGRRPIQEEAKRDGSAPKRNPIPPARYLADDIFEAWDLLDGALGRAMRLFPPQTLAFFADRATDDIVRRKAIEVREWHEEQARARAREQERRDVTPVVHVIKVKSPPPSA